MSSVGLSLRSLWNLEMGSLSVSTVLTYLSAVSWFLPLPWSTGCVPEAGITGVGTLPTNVAIWSDTRAPNVTNPRNQTPDFSDEKSALYDWAILTLFLWWFLREIVPQEKKIMESLFSIRQLFCGIYIFRKTSLKVNFFWWKFWWKR